MYIQVFIEVFYLTLVVVYFAFIGFFMWVTSRKSRGRREESKAEEKGAEKGMERDEKIWLVFLLVVAIVGNIVMLSPAIPSIRNVLWVNQVPEKTFEIFIENYEFKLPKYPVRIKVGQPVEFIVRTNDVTHGFGVFREDGTMVFQIQVLPGYDNRIVWVFDEPGSYTIRCTEYCGFRHSEMVVYDAIMVEGG